MVYLYNTFYYLQMFMHLYPYLNKHYMISRNFLFAFFVAAYIFINNYDINNNNATICIYRRRIVFIRLLICLCKLYNMHDACLVLL